jgi:hypothetical protein
MSESIDRVLGFNRSKTGEKIVIYPITTVDNIIDESTGERLDKTLADIRAIVSQPGSGGGSGPSAGGYRSVATVANRDAIPQNEREEGMLCNVLEDDIVYQLKGGTDNAFWEIFTTGAGGATTASTLAYVPSGTITGVNVQAAIDELETKKADMNVVYSKTEVNDKIANHTPEYSVLLNKPDLSLLHDHVNKATLDKFTESFGELLWGDKTLGDMIAEVYDSDNDGLVDKAKTLNGLITTIAMLNHTTGLTGNIQAQLNALSSGAVFTGEFATWADLVADIPSPQKGYWVFVTTDETKSNAKTQYYHDGVNWIYGGGATVIPQSTDTVLGGIKLAGALANPAGTSDNPLLSPTGVVEGLYKSANIFVGEDGRVTFIEEGNAVFINDGIISPSETWSSDKVNDQFSTKSDVNHVHPQLHDADMIGNVKIDMASVANKRVIGYDSVSGKGLWIDPPGGRVYVGSKVITGDLRLVAGAYTSLFIDEVARTITINSTAGGGSAVPSLTEITHTELIPAGASVFLDLDAAFNKYDIRTLEASNNASVMVDVEVYDSAGEGKRKVYQSNKETYIYDIVNVPCHDKDESKKIHIKVTNYGGIDATISLVITTTNLI